MRCDRKIKMNRFVLFLFFVLSGCSLNARNRSPYIVHAEMVMDESENYQVAGLDLYLLNQTEKDISGFTLVFYVYDSDGNPPMNMRNNIVITVEAEIAAKESLSTCVSLDKYLSSIPEEPYQLDFVYVSKIKYADGTEWDDPFGQSIF